MQLAQNVVDGTEATTRTVAGHLAREKLELHSAPIEDGPCPSRVQYPFTVRSYALASDSAQASSGPASLVVSSYCTTEGKPDQAQFCTIGSS